MKIIYRKRPQAVYVRRHQSITSDAWRVIRRGVIKMGRAADGQSEHYRLADAKYNALHRR